MLSAIRTLTDDCPTYGYRTIWAMLNRRREQAGQNRLNHKCIYRLMSQNVVLLQRNPCKPPGRAHDAQIITIRPNLRCTSDGLEIACWNGHCVRVAFALDTCDREAMSSIATTGGISGEIIRNLILECVERRSTDRVVPHPIEWLSDNGSCYRDHETISFAQSIGPVRASRRSARRRRMGWPRRSSKTFKRDYVYVHDLPDTQSVLAQLPRWFED